MVAGEEFNVIFNLNYGTDNIVEKTTENRLITYIPVRQGYRFNGWYYSDGYVEDIGYDFNRMIEMLHNCGFKYYVYYKNREPITVQI